MNKSKYIFEFFSDIILLIFALVVFSLMSCKETTPNLHVATSAQDTIHTLPQSSNGLSNEPAVKALSNDVKIVTGQEAVAPDQKEKDIETAKDKTGAVAVKVQY